MIEGEEMPINSWDQESNYYNCSNSLDHEELIQSPQPNLKTMDTFCSLAIQFDQVEIQPESCYDTEYKLCRVSKRKNLKLIKKYLKKIQIRRKNRIAQMKMMRQKFKILHLI